MLLDRRTEFSVVGRRATRVDLEATQTATEQTDAPFGGAVREAQVREPTEYRSECDLRLEAGNGGAEAVVDAIAESQLASVVPADVQQVRLGKPVGSRFAAATPRNTRSPTPILRPPISTGSTTTRVMIPVGPSNRSSSSTALARATDPNAGV